MEENKFLCPANQDVDNICEDCEILQECKAQK